MQQQRNNKKNYGNESPSRRSSPLFSRKTDQSLRRKRSIPKRYDSPFLQMQLSCITLNVEQQKDCCLKNKKLQIKRPLTPAKSQKQIKKFQQNQQNIQSQIIQLKHKLFIEQRQKKNALLKSQGFQTELKNEMKKITELEAEITIRQKRQKILREQLEAINQKTGKKQAQLKQTCSRLDQLKQTIKCSRKNERQTQIKQVQKLDLKSQKLIQNMKKQNQLLKKQNEILNDEKQKLKIKLSEETFKNKMQHIKQSRKIFQQKIIELQEALSQSKGDRQRVIQSALNQRQKQLLQERQLNRLLKITIRTLQAKNDARIQQLKGKKNAQIRVLRSKLSILQRQERSLQVPCKRRQKSDSLSLSLSPG